MQTPPGWQPIEPHLLTLRGESRWGDSAAVCITVDSLLVPGLECVGASATVQLPHAAFCVPHAEVLTDSLREFCRELETLGGSSSGAATFAMPGLALRIASARIGVRTGILVEGTFRDSPSLPFSKRWTESYRPLILEDREAVPVLAHFAFQTWAGDPPLLGPFAAEVESCVRYLDSLARQHDGSDSPDDR